MSIDGAGRNQIRFSGMATGLDTEKIIKQMMAAEKTKIDKINQSRTLISWKQEAYREVIDDVMKFKDKYFDVLSKDYILRPSNLSGFEVNYGTEGIASMSATPGAALGSYRVNVTQMATSAKIDGTVNRRSADVVVGNWTGKSIVFNNGSEDTTITIGVGVTSVSELVTELNTQIGASDIKGKITAVQNGNKVEFKVNSGDVINVKSTTVTNDMDGLDGKVINPVRYTKLADLGVPTATNPIVLKLKVDGVAVDVSVTNTGGEATIADLNDAIMEATDGKVKGSISQLTGKYTLSHNNTGSSSSIEIVSAGSTGELLSGLGLTTIDSSEVGKDANVEITTPDGSVSNLVRESNKFSIDGLELELKKVGTTTVDVNSDNEKAFENYTKFFNDYNEMIGKITSKLEEKKSRSFTPLTEEQKSSMDQDEIEKWEKKAKQGILRNDEALSKMLGDLRGVFFAGVEGAGINFGKKSIGLDTSADISQRGKIIIKDPETFKTALKNNGEQIMRLFTKSSDIDYDRNLSQSDRSTRFNESGIFRRMIDIIEDNLSTKRDDDGRKGILLEKAGKKNDVTFKNNILTEQIKAKDKLIKEMTRKMFAKENNLFQKFAKLEKAMNGLNAQSSWLASQLGGGQ